MRACALFLAVLLAMTPAAPEAAAPVAIRFPEGSSHGYVVLRSARGEALAHGEFTQTVRGEQLQSTLVFRFTDGSLYDETTTFSQRGTLRLLAYKLVQKGKSFPEAAEVAFDRKSGRYRARVGGETAEGTVDLPDDLHNGLTGLLLKNLPAGAGGSGHLLAFTPKPQLLNTKIIRQGEDRFLIGDTEHRATRYLVKLEVPGVKGIVATLFGKDPPDLHYWLVTEAVPAFVRFEGQMFLKGPHWTIEMAAPSWPGKATR